MNSIDKLFKKIKEGIQGKNKGVSTGLSKLDKFIGGIQKKMYYLIFSDSGGGKTSLTLYLIYRCLKDNPDKDIVFQYFSLEMSVETLLAKLMGLYIYETFGVIIPYQMLMSWEQPLNSDMYTQYVIPAGEWLKSILPKFRIYDQSLNRDSFYREMMSLLEEYGTFSEINGKKVYTPDNPDKLVVGIVDHIALCSPKPGATKKEEIDAISSYAVFLREKYDLSWIILQQANRASTNMDRRKADLSECSREDLKDSECSYNDSDVCIGIFNPIKLKIKSHRGYPIIVEGDDSFLGLRDYYRGLCLIKNRNGDPDKYIPINFFGEIGYWKELPKAKDISDWTSYLHLSKEEIKDETPRLESKKQIEYNF